LTFRNYRGFRIVRKMEVQRTGSGRSGGERFVAINERTSEQINGPFPTEQAAVDAIDKKLGPPAFGV
jgi:hypothetical protein